MNSVIQQVEGEIPPWFHQNCGYRLLVFPEGDRTVAIRNGVAGASVFKYGYSEWYCFKFNGTPMDNFLFGGQLFFMAHELSKVFGLDDQESFELMSPKGEMVLRRSGDYLEVCNILSILLTEEIKEALRKLLQPASQPA